MNIKKQLARRRLDTPVNHALKADLKVLLAQQRTAAVPPPRRHTRRWLPALGTVAAAAVVCAALLLPHLHTFAPAASAAAAPAETAAAGAPMESAAAAETAMAPQATVGQSAAAASDGGQMVLRYYTLTADGKLAEGGGTGGIPVRLMWYADGAEARQAFADGGPATAQSDLDGQTILWRQGDEGLTACWTNERDEGFLVTLQGGAGAEEVRTLYLLLQQISIP